MNQSFFIGATAAYQQDKRLGIHGNNISNVNTYGFKAEKSRFTQLMCEQLPVAEGEDEQVGVGGTLLASATNYASGGAVRTRRDTDYMIQGDGYFALADLSNGEISYTRCGAFQVGKLLEPTGEVDQYDRPVTEDAWYLADGEGRFVLGRNGGLISVEDGKPEGEPGVFDFINYDGMQHLDGTRFLPREKNGGMRRGMGEVVSGWLEPSNVDLAEELSKVIESQRAYGMALKLVQTSDEIESTINSLRG